MQKYTLNIILFQFEIILNTFKLNRLSNEVNVTPQSQPQLQLSQPQVSSQPQVQSTNNITNTI